MSKRIYSDRVKKWAKGLGITGIPLAVLMIWFVISLGSFNITGFSGDTICAGTEFDPCYAYINFTANEDVFIYPSDEWSSTAFSTDIQPKSVKMYRSWGNSWREIKLNQSCTGTWCGLSNSKDTRKFSIAFRKDREYQIRFKVLKNNPEEDIKWSFTKDVDPVFLGLNKNNIFTELIKSEASIGSGEAIYKINSPYELDKEDIKFNFDIEEGNNINYYDLFYLTNTKEKVSEYKDKQIEINCSDNSTDAKKKCYETIQIESGYKTIEKEEWIKLDKIPKGENTIKMIAYWDPHIGDQKIDWKPIINLYKDKYKLQETITLQNDEWAWFNSSWSKCKNIEIQSTEEKNNYPTITNKFSGISLTGLTFDSTDELRIVNSSCNEDGIEIPFDVLSSDSTSAEVIFLANLTNGNVTYSVYYNYSGVSAPSYDTDLDCDDNFVSNDHFNSSLAFALAGAKGGVFDNPRIIQGSGKDINPDGTNGLFNKASTDTTGTCTSIFNGSVMSKLQCNSTNGNISSDYFIYSHNPYIDTRMISLDSSWSFRNTGIRFNGTLLGGVYYTNGNWSAGKGYVYPNLTEGWAFSYNTSVTNEVFGEIWNYSFVTSNHTAFYTTGSIWFINGENPVNTPTLGTGTFYSRVLLGTLDDVNSPSKFNNTEYELFVRNPFVYSLSEESYVPLNFSFGNYYRNITAELGSLINITANISSGTLVFVDINHPDYGINYDSGNDSVSFNFNISYFRKNNLNDSSTSKNLTYIGSGNNTIYLHSHQYDELIEFTINLTGYANGTSYPRDVKIYINNTLSNDIGVVYNGNLSQTNFSTGSVASLTFQSSGTQTVYIPISSDAIITSATMNITGFNQTINITERSGDNFEDGVVNTSYWTEESWSASYCASLSGNVISGEIVNSTDGYYTYDYNTLYLNTYGFLRGNGLSTIQNFNDNKNHTINFTMEYSEGGGKIVPFTLMIWNGTESDTTFNDYCYVGGTIIQNGEKLIDDTSSDISKSDWSITVDSSTKNISLYEEGSYYSSVNMSNHTIWKIMFYMSSKQIASGGFYDYFKIYDFNVTSTNIPNTQYLTNPTIFIGSVDSNTEWDYTGEFNLTQNVSDFQSEIQAYLTTCSGTCSVPIYVSASSQGGINLTNLNISYSINSNPISLDNTLVSNFLTNETNFADIKIDIFSNDSGIIKVDDIRYDYLGGNKTYDVLVHNVDYSSNLTRSVTYYYSDWDYNFPNNVDYLEFIPKKQTSKNVTPYGQTVLRPILNITNYGYGGKNSNFSAYINESNDCINITLGNSSTKENSVPIPQPNWIDVFNNTSYLESNGIWMWADYNCSYNYWNWWFPALNFRNCCFDCDICSEDLT